MTVSMVKAVTTGSVTLCDSEWVGTECRSALALAAHTEDTTASGEGCIPFMPVVVSESASFSMGVSIQLGDELFPVSVLTLNGDVVFTRSAPLNPNKLAETPLISVVIDDMEAVCVSLLEMGEAVIPVVGGFRLYPLELVLTVSVTSGRVILTGAEDSCIEMSGLVTGSNMSPWELVSL